MAITTEPDIHSLVVCANVFIRRGNEYLVLKRSPQKRFAPGVVHPVGGKLELDEDAFSGAIREVTEETGVAVKNMRLEAVINELLPPPDRNYNWLIFHFSADYDSGEVSKTEEGELVWLTADEILASQLFPSVRPLIAQILDPAVGTVFATFEYRGDEIDDSKSIIQVTAK